MRNGRREWFPHHAQHGTARWWPAGVVPGRAGPAAWHGGAAAFCNAWPAATAMTAAQQAHHKHALINPPRLDGILLKVGVRHQHRADVRASTRQAAGLRRAAAAAAAAAPRHPGCYLWVEDEERDEQEQQHGEGLCAAGAATAATPLGWCSEHAHAQELRSAAAAARPALIHPPGRAGRPAAQGGRGSG